MKLAFSAAAAILLAACASTPKPDATADKSNYGQLYAASGEACPPGTRAQEMPVSYAGVTRTGCRSKADWQRIEQMTRAYERCMGRLNGGGNIAAQEAACKYLSL
jgi:hypothetical protein